MSGRRREFLLALTCLGATGAAIFVVLNYDRSPWARYTLRFLLACLIAFLSLSRKKI